jgi:hypothetical protein
MTRNAVLAVLLVALAATMDAQTKPRARDLGVPFEGTPGPLNAITDVAGVTMTGIDGHRVESLSHDRLREILPKYNRLTK